MILSLLFWILKILILFKFLWLSANKSSRIFFILDGINSDVRLIWIYFSHFIIVRILFAFMVYTAAYVQAGTMVVLLLIIQVISFLINILKLYNSTLLHFQILIFWELNLLIDTIVIMYAYYSNAISTGLGMAISCLNIAFAILLVLSLFFNSFISFIKWRRW